MTRSTPRVRCRSAQQPDDPLVEAELGGYFPGGREALDAKPFRRAFEVAGQAVSPPYPAYVRGRIGLALPVSAPHCVQLARGAFVAVRFEQPIDCGDRFRECLADLRHRSRQLKGLKRQGATPAHAQTDRHLGAVPGERRILDQKAEQPLAIRVSGLGGVPYLLEVARQFPYAVGLPLRELGIARRGAGLAFLAGLFQIAQALVPLGFERCRHQPVGRVDLEEPAPRQIGLVADGLNAPGALGIGLGELQSDLLLDRQGKIDVLAVQHVDHEAGYPGIDEVAAHALAGLPSVMDRLCIANVEVARRPVAMRKSVVVLHAHAPPAVAADHPRLQQRRPLAGRRGARARRPEGGGVACQGGSIAKVLVPVDEAHMGVLNADVPVLHRHHAQSSGPVRPPLDVRLAIDIGAGVARISQCAVERCVFLVGANPTQQLSLSVGSSQGGLRR